LCTSNVMLTYQNEGQKRRHWQLTKPLNLRHWPKLAQSTPDEAPTSHLTNPNLNYIQLCIFDNYVRMRPTRCNKSDLLLINSISTPPTTSRHDTKWTTFTYVSPQIRKITNLFKHTNTKIAFKCNDTIAQLLKPAKNTIPHTPHDRSGIYSLTCCTCHQAYVGQTSRSLNLHYQEHTRSIRNNKPTSAYALHILHNTHEHGPMNTTMDRWTPLWTDEHHHGPMNTTMDQWTPPWTSSNPSALHPH